MTSHETTIQYVGQPEGYRSDIPLALVENCELTPNSNVGIHYEPDLTGIGLSFRHNITDARAIRSLNYDGASRERTIITHPKPLIQMLQLSGAPVTFYPDRGGLVGQIDYTPNHSIEPPASDATPRSTVADYSSGHYGIRIPASIVDQPEASDLLNLVGDSLWVWLEELTNGSLGVIVDLREDNAPSSAQEISANPNMLYRQDDELGFLFPISAGDVLFAGERELVWRRENLRVIGQLQPE